MERMFLKRLGCTERRGGREVSEAGRSPPRTHGDASHTHTLTHGCRRERRRKTHREHTLPGTGDRTGGVSRVPLNWLRAAGGRCPWLHIRLQDPCLKSQPGVCRRAGRAEGTLPGPQGRLRLRLRPRCGRKGRQHTSRTRSPHASCMGHVLARLPCPSAAPGVGAIFIVTPK